MVQAQSTLKRENRNWNVEPLGQILARGQAVPRVMRARAIATMAQGGYLLDSSDVELQLDGDLAVVLAACIFCGQCSK